jgi:hypothetical protein
MSVWRDLDVEQCILDVLADVTEGDHHFGRPFLTAYQLAIEVNRRRPDIATTLEVQVGGAGIGERTSLAQYLARQLSGQIRDDHAYAVEGAFLSGSGEVELTYRGVPAGAPAVTSSLTESGWPLSMVRLRP